MNRESIQKYQKYRIQKEIPFVLKIGLGRFRFTVDRSVISLRTFNFIDNAYVVRYTPSAKSMAAGHCEFWFWFMLYEALHIHEI